MQLRFLGKDPGSQHDECPSLYDTDRGTYLVQGWRVDQSYRGQLDLAGQEECVLIPWRLMTRLDASRINPAGHPAPRIIPVDGERFVVIGRRVEDADAWTQMQVPEHEDVVEVPAGFALLREEGYGAADA